MPSLENTSSQIEQRRPVPRGAEPRECVVHLAGDAIRGVGGAERGGTADPCHPRLERRRPELLGRERGRCRRRAVVGVLGDHGPAVAR